MKKLLFIVFVLTALLSCENNVGNSKPSRINHRTNTSPGETICLDIDELIHSYPDVFGEQCMMFESDDDVESTLDALEDMSSDELIEWADSYGLQNNRIILSNAKYREYEKTIEDEYATTFDAAASNADLLYQMEADLLVLFNNDESGLIIRQEGDGIDYRYSFCPMTFTLQAFCNEKGIFTVGSTIYKYFNDSPVPMVVDVSTDLVDSDSSGGLTAIDSLLHAVGCNGWEDYLEIFNPHFFDPLPITNCLNDSSCFRRVLYNQSSDFKVDISFSANEIPRGLHNEHSYREVSVHVRSFHLHDGIKITRGSQGRLSYNIPTYTGEYEDLETYHAVKYGRFKDRTYYKKYNHSYRPRLSYIKLAEFDYQFENYQGVRN